ncbi:MAG: radical SAM protein [Proteobacteria bacterium]|nr:radical SAM protein [Pseudomonadota bacterium]
MTASPDGLPTRSATATPETARPPRATARVALVRPPTFQILGSLSYFGAVPPIGLAYIAAVLRDAGHEVTVIDAPGEAPTQVERVADVVSLFQTGLTPRQIVERIPADTDMVGITHMFLHEWPVVRAIAEEARRQRPSAIIVIGGENATAYWRRIFDECGAVDACVVGEGEMTALEICARAASGTSLQGTPGLVLRDQQNATPPTTRQRITHLDTLPLPAWDLFPMEGYFRAHDAFGVHRGRSIPMLATRGCPFQCTFCSSPTMWTTRYVTRPPRDVVDEIRTYVERYHIENVDFCDLTAIIKRDWILAFCEALRQSGLRITWQLPVGTRSEALDGEVLRALRASGCRNVTYAPESGSERLLRRIKKRVRLDRLMGSLKEAIEAGLVTRVNIIIGHPDETRADVWESAKLLWKAAWMGCHDTAVMIFAPYPGSEDYAILEREGRVGHEPEDDFLALARSGRSSRTFCRHMGCRELLIIQFTLLVMFYGLAYVRRPSRILDLVGTLLTGKEQTQVEQLVRTKITQVRQALGDLVRSLSATQATVNRRPERPDEARGRSRSGLPPS